MKNLLLINESLTILFLRPTHPGKMHDKRIADESPYPLPPQSRLLQDLGFVGYFLEGVQIELPHNKPRGRALTPEQKAENRLLAQRRVRIEHVSSSVKRCRIVKDTIRLFKESRDRVMEICCALHNFRIRIQPWKVMV